MQVAQTCEERPFGRSASGYPLPTMTLNLSDYAAICGLGPWLKLRSRFSQQTDFRGNASCVCAANACSAGLLVRCGRNSQSSVCRFPVDRTHCGTFGERTTDFSKSASAKLVTRFAQEAGLPRRPRAPKKAGDAVWQQSTLQ
jgi:hypothetical protein